MLTRMSAEELDDWRDFFAAEDAIDKTIAAGQPSAIAHRLVYTAMTEGEHEDDADD